MSERLDRIEALLEGHGMAMADIRARQLVMQQQNEAMQQRQEALQRQQEAFQQRQEIFQNQLENLAALVSDTRQASLYMLQTAENHEQRLVKVEDRQSEE